MKARKYGHTTVRITDAKGFTTLFPARLALFIICSTPQYARGQSVSQGTTIPVAIYRHPRNPSGSVILTRNYLGDI